MHLFAFPLPGPVPAAPAGWAKAADQAEQWIVQAERIRVSTAPTSNWTVIGAYCLLGLLGYLLIGGLIAVIGEALQPVSHRRRRSDDDLFLGWVMLLWPILGAILLILLLAYGVTMLVTHPPGWITWLGLQLWRLAQLVRRLCGWTPEA